MKRNIILLSALGAALFSIASCSKGGDADKPHGKEMSAEEIKTFTKGFIDKYGENSAQAREKSDLLFATVKKGTFSATTTGSMKTPEATFTRDDKVKGEFDLADDYAHFYRDATTVEGEDKDVQKVDTIVAKDGDFYFAYVDDNGTKSKSARPSIYGAMFIMMQENTENIFNRALNFATEYDTFEADAGLKMYKEEKTYFAEFKIHEKDAERGVEGTESFKFRYNADYLPIYANVSTSSTQTDGKDTATLSTTTTYKIESTDKVTKVDFDKTKYAAIN